MDIFAHGLWSFALFHKQKKRWWAVLFGVLPDLVAFGPFFLWSFFTRTWSFGPPQLAGIPQYVFLAYRVTHSLIIFLAVLGIVSLLWKEWVVPLLGWGLHILIDIPTHTRAFFPTPFLWPISNAQISGISWADPAFMALNYLALVSVYFFLFVAKKRKKKV